MDNPYFNGRRDLHLFNKSKILTKRGFEPMTSLLDYKGFYNHQAIIHVITFYAIFMYITFYVKHLKKKNFF